MKVVLWAGLICLIVALGCKKADEEVAQEVLDGVPHGFVAVVDAENSDIVAAGTIFNTAVKFLLLKTDAQGNEQWVRTYSEYGRQECADMDMTSDGGFLLGGFARTGDLRENFYVLRTDADGNELWSRTYVFSEFDILTAIKALPSGEFVFTGYSAGETFLSLLVHCASNGDTIRTQQIAIYDSWYPIINEVIQLSDQSFAFCGQLGNAICVARLDSLGGAFSGYYSYFDAKSELYAIAEREDESIVAAGYASDSHRDYRQAISVPVYPSLGSEQFRFEGAHNAQFNDIKPVLGGTVAAGYTSVLENGVDQHVLAVRFDNTGDTLWTYTKTDSLDWGCFESVCVGSNGDIVLAGRQDTEVHAFDNSASGNTHFLLTRLTADGQLLWSQMYY